MSPHHGHIQDTFGGEEARPSPRPAGRRHRFGRTGKEGRAQGQVQKGG